jgi:hypothetical protein
VSLIHVCALHLHVVILIHLLRRQSRVATVEANAPVRNQIRLRKRRNSYCGLIRLLVSIHRGQHHAEPKLRRTKETLKEILKNWRCDAMRELARGMAGEMPVDLASSRESSSEI